MIKPSLTSKILGLFILGLFLVSLVPVAEAGIAGGNKWTVNADPGETLTLDYTFSSLDDEATRIIIAPGEGTVTEQGTVLLKNKNFAPYDNIGLWLELEGADETGVREAVVEAHGSISGSFTITVPESATPSIYAGGIVAQQFPVDMPVGTSVMSPGVASLIYLQVNGEQVVDYDWTNFSLNQEKDPAAFEFELENSGNVMIKPVVDLSISNFFGLSKSEISSELSQIMPGSEGVVYRIDWDDAPIIAFGSATATMTFQTVALGSDGGATIGEPVVKTTSIIILPLLQMIIAFAVFVLAFIFFYRKERKLQKARATYTNLTSKKDEPLAIIANRYQADWKFLAKLNKVKAPYLIFKGQKILVPPKKGKK